MAQQWKRGLEFRGLGPRVISKLNAPDWTLVLRLRDFADLRTELPKPSALKDPKCQDRGF